MTRLRVIQHNVLSWDRRKYDLSNTYRQFNPDIILINSHGLKDTEKIKIPGYRTHQRNITGENMDGVAIAIKTNIKYKIVDDFISETLAIETDTSDGTITIATTYLPPRRPYTPHPDFSFLFRQQNPVFVVGDFNARHPQLGYSSANQVGRDLIDYLRHHTAKHLGPHFPTFYGPRSTSTPDLVLSNRSNHLSHSLTPGPLTVSDHIPIIMDISTSPILTPIPTTLDYQKTNWNAFTAEEDLKMTNLQDVSQGTLEDIDEAVDTWMNTVKRTMRIHIPNRMYRVEPHPKLSRESQIARIQFTALKERANRVGWTYNDYRHYIRLRQDLQSSRLKESRDSWEQTITRLSDTHKDPRSFWKRIKQLSGRSNGPETYLVDDNGQKHHSEKCKESLLTPVWRSIFQENEDDEDDNEEILEYLRRNSDRLSPHESADPDRLTGDSALSCRISMEEIKNTFRRGRPTCPGSSKINKTVLQHLPEPALNKLKEILNAALSAGYFPDSFKKAEMKMIVKPGKDPTRPGNYRPISLLEVPGKVFEKIIVSRLRDHLDNENLYNQGQYGFRRWRGTTHAIAIATETIAIHQASGYRCNLVLRDVSKAFDKVWHTGLKYKILQLGLTGTIERLLCDFLEDRTARINIGKHAGEWFPLGTGVPQGSVLSPTLYTIYTNDCPTSISGINIQYADDISQVVYHPGPSKDMANARTEREILRINTFEDRWKINTNLAKFTVVPLATRNPSLLTVNDEVVDQQQHGTFLGLHVGRYGYTSHVKQRVCRAKSVLTTLYRFNDLSPKIKLHLVKTLVLPVLTYPPIPLHSMSKTAISRLQKVQNSALRFVYNTRWYHYRRMESLHEASSLPPLNIRLKMLATRVWDQLEAEGGEQFLALQELHRQAPIRNHNWFPRSLLTLERMPVPEPRFH